LLPAIVVAVVAGAASGWFFGPAMLAQAWIGTTFLNAFKMIIVPLVLSAIVSGVGQLGQGGQLGRLTGVLLTYFMLTTAMAVGIGLVLVNLVEPGIGAALGTVDDGFQAKLTEKSQVGIAAVFESLISPSLVTAAAELQLMPVILFGIALGLAARRVEKGEAVIQFFQGLDAAMMQVIHWLMLAAPLGIFSLVAANLGKAGGAAFGAQVAALGKFVLVVLVGLALQYGGLLLILKIVARRGFEYVRHLSQALLTAFGTASSAATLPLTMEGGRRAGLDPRALHLSLPLGATVNMNGTALYEACAALFIAQAYGIELTATQQVIVFLTSILAAIGAAGIPEAGLVTLVIVLKAVGLPLEGIGLLMAINWFLDRFRTTVNVWGDAVGAAVLDRYLPMKNR
jgi:Na+/H+-dicarboxylate symporter